MIRGTPFVSERSTLRKDIMKTIIDEVDAPSTGVPDFGLSRVAALAGLAMETKSDDLNQSGDNKSAFVQKNTGIEAICIWLDVPMPASVPFSQLSSYNR